MVPVSRNDLIASRPVPSKVITLSDVFVFKTGFLVKVILMGVVIRSLLPMGVE